MKRLLTILCALTLALCGLTGCKKTFTISFVQEGYETVVIEVKEGDSLDKSLLPALKGKKGYTAAWKRTNFQNVQANATVGVAYTPNVYTVSYDTDGGEFLDGVLTQSVTFDASYELKTPTRENYDFVCWERDSVVFESSGVWTLDENVSLKAKWLEIKPTGFIIAFQQPNGQVVQIEVEPGGSLDESQIPEIIPVNGYTVTWERTSFENVQSNIVVGVKKVPKNYRVIYQTAEGGTEYAKTVTYGSKYSFDVPGRNGYTFKGYAVVGGSMDGQVIPLSGTWQYHDVTRLIAKWEEGDTDIYTPWI